MKKSKTLKLVSNITSLLILSSCASISPIRTATKHYQSDSPSGMINDYRNESQKDELNQIITERQEDKPHFLIDKNNKNVKMWINYFSGRGKDRFERYLENGEKYRPIIEETFDDYGLPRELYFVGLIESGYYLKAKSHANAVGPWQFIKSTGKRYGLHINSSVDERQSIIKATKAAALFFQDLYNIFGSWELALSAYNAGEYGIIKRIRKANTRDYYELSASGKLPKETIHYVPKVLAAMEVFQNASKYNVTIPKYKNNTYNNLKEITLSKQNHLNTISNITKTPISVIKFYNPDIRGQYTPKIKNGFTLYIPENKNFDVATIEKMETQNQKFAAIDKATPNKVENYLRHKVRSGENLHVIARKNHTSISHILKINNLKKRTIYIGQTLKIPKVDFDTYTVKRGDHLIKIAKKHGISVDKIKQLNDMKNSKIYPGQKLIVSIN